MVKKKKYIIQHITKTILLNLPNLPSLNYPNFHLTHHFCTSMGGLDKFFFLFSHQLAQSNLHTLGARGVYRDAVTDPTDWHRSSRTAAATDQWSRCRWLELKWTFDAGAVHLSDQRARNRAPVEPNRYVWSMSFQRFGPFFIRRHFEYVF